MGSPSGRVGRVTPCAPQTRICSPSGAHGVTRPTCHTQYFFVAVWQFPRRLVKLRVGLHPSMKQVNTPFLDLPGVTEIQGRLATTPWQFERNKMIEERGFGFSGTVAEKSPLSLVAELWSAVLPIVLFHNQAAVAQTHRLRVLHNFAGQAWPLAPLVEFAAG